MKYYSLRGGLTRIINYFVVTARDLFPIRKRLLGGVEGRKKTMTVEPINGRAPPVRAGRSEARFIQIGPSADA